MKQIRIAAVILVGSYGMASFAFAQAPSESFPPTATMKQLMLDLIHPASNDILLFVSRGAPKDEKEWAAVRRSAVTLAESGNLLMARGRARDQGDWMKDAKALVDAGAAAYKAALAKDANALAKLTDSLDASCTTCHKQYRPNVFPREGGSK
jgi:cytochrome c556